MEYNKDYDMINNEKYNNKWTKIIKSSLKKFCSDKKFCNDGAWQVELGNYWSGMVEGNKIILTC